LRRSIIDAVAGSVEEVERIISQIRARWSKVLKGAISRSNECWARKCSPIVRRMSPMLPPDLMLQIHSVAAFKGLHQLVRR